VYVILLLRSKSPKLPYSLREGGWQKAKRREEAGTTAKERSSSKQQMTIKLKRGSHLYLQRSSISIIAHPNILPPGNKRESSHLDLALSLKFGKLSLLGVLFTQGKIASYKRAMFKIASKSESTSRALGDHEDAGLEL
jgi:hypothetical protein